MHSTPTIRCVVSTALLALTATVASAAIAPGDLSIREFRLRGPASATDEYVVIHNKTAADITVASGDATAGFAVASSGGTVAFVIPNGTVIKAKGHYLGVNTTGFSLGVTADATWTADIGDGAGLALFDSANPAAFGVSALTIDAVGVGSSAAPYLEGPALASLTAAGEYAWVRKAPNGAVVDTGDSSADFVLVSTNGGIYNGVQSILGAPAPTNSTNQDIYGGLIVSLVEPALNVNAGPNRVRVPTPVDRLEFRRRLTNNTGSPITGMRLRFMDLTTFNSPGYSPGTAQADLRPNTSATTGIAMTSIGATSVTGLSLLVPPAQPIGGGWNSVLTIPGGPLAPGASVDINIALRVTRVGGYRFFATVETTTGNAAPSVTTSGGTTAFTENAAPVAVDGALTVSDDSGVLNSATVTISNLLDAGSELLTATPSGSILAGDIAYVAPTLTITRAGGSVTDYQAVLRSVKYENTANAPTTTTRTVDFAVNDGLLSSTTASKSVSVTPANDPPVLTAGATLSYTENDPASVIDGTITVADPDSASITQATVQITTNYQNGQDMLSFATIGPISGSFVAGTGTLTLSGTDTLANYQAALRTVKYNNTSENPSTLARTVQWRATDGTDQSVAGVTSTINVTAVNDAPVVTAGGTLNYTENQAATAIDTTITVTDPDNANLTGATVQITGNYANGNDVLSYATALGITGVFSAPTGTLTLSGTTTVANYQTALRNVRYSNTSENPTTGARTISWQVNDGAGVNNLSSLVTSTINVTAVNDPPTALTKTASAQSNMKIVGISAGLLTGASDPDNGVNGCSTTLSIASINTGTNGTVSNVNLGAGTFDFDPNPGFTGTATATYTVSDDGCPGPAATSASATINITVSGPVIWFVDSSVAGPGDGRLSNPFKTLASADAVDAANHKIFLATGTYSSGITLNSGEALIGQGALGAFDAVLGVTPPSGTITRPSLNGTRPTIAVASGTAVILGSGNTLQGLNVTNSNGAGITGSAVGTLSLADFDVTVTGGSALNLTASGTVTATGTDNDLTSVTGAALNVANVTIGGGGLRFKSISAGNNTGAADPSDGIVLNNTGAGQLIVTGNGNASLGGDSSGGVIQHTTNYGISLTNATSPSFTNMTIHDIARNGIDGIGVTNFTFDNGQITNTGTAVAGQYEENGIAFVEAATFTASTVSGNVTITDSMISGAHRNAVMIETWSGTISNLNISGNTLSGPSLAAAVKDATLATTADVADAIHVLSQGSAGTTAHITAGTINSNTISGFEFLSGGIFIGGNGIRVAGGSGNASNSAVATIGAAASPIEVANNDVDDVGSNAIAVSFNGMNGLSNFNVHNNGSVGNPMSNAEGLGISVFFGGSGTFSALVNNNAIDNNGPTVNAGSAGIGVQLDDGPAGLANSTGVAAITVNGNRVSNPDGIGIRGIVRASLGTLNLKIQNNDVGTPSAANRNAIRVDSGSATGNVSLCLNLSGNTGPVVASADNLVGSGVNAGIGVRKQGTVAGTNFFGLNGIVANPSTAQVQTNLLGLNTATGVDIISGSAYMTCSLP
ncbi:MAG: cadherin-like domain-containing protein [Vicinamibacteria bacterium]|nr:cadherin-like domain-containing protein [Vicinamibacteria bacterium]